MTILSFFYRIISALMGGVFGTLFIFLVYATSIFLLGNIENPITAFILIFMIFIGSLTANLSSGLLFTLADPDKYHKKADMLWQAFLINMFLFIAVFPFYILLSDIQIVAIIHLILSAFASNLIYEIFTFKGTYTLTGLYGSMFAILLIFIILTLLQTTSVTSLLLFTILPFIWGFLSFFTLLAEIVYEKLYKTLGIAFLDPKI